MRRTEPIGSRKEKHLSICTDPRRFPVEGNRTGFEQVHFLHRALPEIAEPEVDTRVRFLGRQVALPLFISCMTGGSERGSAANRELARAAQTAGIPVGMGSIRVLFDQPELFPHFHLKALAPDVPVLANIGGVQLRDLDPRGLLDITRRLEADALVVHLNPGQELFQPEGDRDFRGIRAAIGRLCAAGSVPVIVKETGFGIDPQTVEELRGLGVAYVDLAGAGGTNWITVESYRLTDEPGDAGVPRRAAGEFRDWGLPTALLLAALGGTVPGILASGGIRGGMDAAKALALGAELAGMALPFIREAVSGGAEAALRLIRQVERVLRTVMVLTGSRTVAELRQGRVRLEPALRDAAASLASLAGAPAGPGEAP